MKGSHSRLLQVVIAGLLLCPAQASATIYDDERVPVIGDRTGIDYGSYFGGVSTDYYYRDIEERSGPDGSSGSGDEEPVSEDEQALCNAISALVSAECDLKNPPVLTVNGCGGGTSANLVPDYLLVNGVPVVRLGAIFSEACNEHDRCYGTYLFDKEECDASLTLDMIDFAKARMSSVQWLFYQVHVRVQAMNYGAVLQQAPIKAIADGLFASAQAEGACRAFAKNAKEAGCLN